MINESDTRKDSIELITTNWFSEENAAEEQHEVVDTRRTVVHVVESWGGGVASAVSQYVASTPEFQHYLIRRIRTGDYKEDSSQRGFVQILDLPEGHLRAWGRLRKLLKSLKPSIVHAHSSFAGAYVRTLSPRSTSSALVVYTPHCYAFERKDLPSLAAWAFKTIEFVLSRRADVVAGCSEREASLAQRMYRRGRVVVVPNVSGSLDAPSSSAEQSVRSDIVAVGRMAAQKDPSFFVRVFLELKKLDPEASARWVGGGTDPRLVDEASQIGVEVTGWQTRESSVRMMRGGRLYLHTALWEGFPMTLLEACTAGLPILARAIPALTGAPERWTVRNPREMAESALALLRSETLREQNVAEWTAWLSVNTSEMQRTRLLEVYETSRR